MGGKVGDILESHSSGEYQGFGIMLLENVRPCLTDQRVVKALAYLQ